MWSTEPAKTVWSELRTLIKVPNTPIKVFDLTHHHCRQTQLRMKHMDRLLILTIDGEKVEDAEHLARQQDGVLAVSALDFVDGMLGTTAETIGSATMRDCVRKIAAVIEPILDRKSGVLFSHAVGLKLGDVQEEL